MEDSTPRARRCRRLLPASAALVATGWLMASCGTLDPHIFSDRVHEPKRPAPQSPAPQSSAPQAGADNDAVTLDAAYADAAQAQRRYLAAIAEQGNAMPKLSAALIGLSAVSLFKGVTHPNTKDLAGAGVLGGAGWAYGNTLISRPRLDVYRAGAEALSCAMTAVEPLRVGRTQLGAADDDAAKRTVYGALRRLNEQELHAQGRIDHFDALRQPITLTTLRPAPPKRVPVPENCDTIDDPSPARKRALVDECKARPPRTRLIPGGPPREERETFEAPPALLSAFSAVDREIRRAQATEASADAAIRALAAAGPALWHKSLNVQLKVSAEIDKTVPDLASVLAAAKGMSSVAGSISGLDFAALDRRKTPREVQLQSSGKPRAETAEDRRAMNALLDAAQRLARARISLEALVHPFTGLTDSALREAINACSVRTTGIELKVSPAAGEISVAVGSSAVFFVSGGSGAPSAQVVVGPKSEVAMRTEGGQFRFEYTPPPSAQPGDVVALRFTDGGGSAHHFVLLRIIAAAVEAKAENDAADKPANEQVKKADAGAATAKPASAASAPAVKKANTAPVS